jgi:hypothetical protein
MNNKEGTIGYIMVSATDTKDVKFVDKLNGKPLKIKYQPNAYLEQIKKTYIHEGRKNSRLTDFSFELDEIWQT